MFPSQQGEATILSRPLQCQVTLSLLSICVSYPRARAGPQPS